MYPNYNFSYAPPLRVMNWLRLGKISRFSNPNKSSMPMPKTGSNSWSTRRWKSHCLDNQVQQLFYNLIYFLTFCIYRELCQSKPLIINGIELHQIVLTWACWNLVANFLRNTFLLARCCWLSQVIFPRDYIPHQKFKTERPKTYI